MVSTHNGVQCTLYGRWAGSRGGCAVREAPVTRVASAHLLIAVGCVCICRLRRGLPPTPQALLHAVRGSLPPAAWPLLLLWLRSIHRQTSEATDGDSDGAKPHLDDAYMLCGCECISAA